jgi:hypothetical protein
MVVRHVLFALAIVLSITCHPAVAPTHPVRHTAPDASRCRPVSHRAPATNSPRSQHAQFQTTIIEATPTMSSDPLAAGAAVARVERRNNSLHLRGTASFSTVSHTPPYLRTLVLLI